MTDDVRHVLLKARAFILAELDVRRRSFCITGDDSALDDCGARDVGEAETLLAEIEAALARPMGEEAVP